MNLISPTFFCFFAVTIIVYRIVRKPYKYLVTAAAGCIFYGWGSPLRVLLLVLSTAIVYTGGRLLGRDEEASCCLVRTGGSKEKTAAKQDTGEDVKAGAGADIRRKKREEEESRKKERAGKEKRKEREEHAEKAGAVQKAGTAQKAGAKERRRIYSIFFALNIAVLVIYKILNYTGIALPVGLSFYIFQSSTYLHDVYHRRLLPERNFIRCFAFVSFFPSVLSGPIQKAEYLMPQIKDPQDPTSEQRIHGYICFVWGMFEKACVSDGLSGAVSYIFDYSGFYTGIYHLTAALLFAVQLYADFSGYSDMAIGAATMLGFKVERNFDNPFLSLSLKELWNRWHVSLNDWFMENIYIPLGGSRRGKARKYVNIMTVFLISGLWHGQGLHFVLWGLLNGILMLIGEWTDGFRKGIRRKLHIPEDAGWLLWIRRIIVFLLFAFAFIFFRAPSVEGALIMVRGIFTIRPYELSGFYPQQMFDGSTGRLFLALLAILLFFGIQYLRRARMYRNADGSRGYVLISGAYGRFRSAPVFFQMLVLALALTASIFAVCLGDTAANTQFIYFNF